LVTTLHHDTYPAIDPTTADLSGKVVLVTGASKGIGKAIAIAFAQAGVSGLVLLARSSTKAVEAECLAAQRPGKILKLLSLSVDVTDTAQVIDAAKHVKETFGRLDVAVNNAGYLTPPKPMAESDPYDWWKVWEFNIRGVYNVTQAFIPLLIECGGDKLIVNVASDLAHVMWRGFSVCITTKFAQLRLTEAIMADYGAEGVLAFVLHPCATLTDLNSILPADVQEFLTDTPELAAHFIVWLVRKRRDWLGGRYVSALWDVNELEGKKQEIIEGNKLKMKLVL
ncbi:putative oxidoreductase, partial [Sparassis latifolia]